jgi:hypothetical protein
MSQNQFDFDRPRDKDHLVAGWWTCRQKYFLADYLWEEEKLLDHNWSFTQPAWSERKRVMTKLTELVPSNARHLKAIDLPEGAAVKVIISHFEMEEMPEGDEKKCVVYFSGKEKGLILNVTNRDVLLELFGDNIDKMIGQEVVIYRTTTKFKGETVPAIRIRGPERMVDDVECPF